MKTLSSNSQAIPQSWIDHFIQFEGNSPHFYLDGVHIVTIGIGCTISKSASIKLPFAVKNTNLRATSFEIAKDFDEISNKPAGQKLSYYESFCKTYLPEQYILSLFDERLQQFLAQINARFPLLKDFPESAQLVFVDMAFNLGISGLCTKFPKFLNHFLDQDFKLAATECERNGIGKARNDWTKETLISLGDKNA